MEKRVATQIMSKDRKRKGTKRIFITPIYQRILARALEYVVVAFNEGTPLQVWTSLKTLFHVGPLEVKEDCKDMLQRINEEVNKMSTPLTLKTAGAERQAIESLEEYLARNNFDFLDELIKSLVDHHYLERGQRLLTPELMDELEASDET